MILAKPKRKVRFRTDLYAYLAGILDGEGHIIAYTTWNNGIPVIILGVTNTNRRPLEMFERYFGGKIKERIRHENPRAKKQYEWICRDKAEIFWALSRMLPWLIIKRARAKAAIVIIQHSPATGYAASRTAFAVIRRAFRVFGSKHYGVAKTNRCLKVIAA